jgi:DNA-directed RNA polymerase specialized sigma24 family protein
MMTAKGYLVLAGEIISKLKSMAVQLEIMKSAAQYITTLPSDMPKSGTRNVYRNEDAIVRVIDFEEKMRLEYAKLADINDTINSLADPMCQAVIIKRYLERPPKGYTWIELAEALDISKSKAHKHHNEALAEIEKIIHNRTVLDE